MKYELTHDTIAQQVATKVSADAKARRKVEALLQQAMELNTKRGTLLSIDQLEEIRVFESVLRLSNEEMAFITASKKALQQTKSRNRTIIIGVIAVLALATVFSIKQARDATKAARFANAQRFAALARQELDGKNFNDALQYAYESLNLQPENNPIATQILVDVYNNSDNVYAPLKIASLQQTSDVLYTASSADNRMMVVVAAVNQRQNVVVFKNSIDN